MMMGGPETVFGIRYCTYIWSMVISPGAGVLVAESGKLVFVVPALTKNPPSSCSSNGPPRDPAAAAATMPASSGAASTAEATVVRLGFARMILFTVFILPRMQGRSKGYPVRMESGYALLHFEWRMSPAFAGESFFRDMRWRQSAGLAAQGSAARPIGPSSARAGTSARGMDLPASVPKEVVFRYGLSAEAGQAPMQTNAARYAGPFGADTPRCADTGLPSWRSSGSAGSSS